MGELRHREREAPLRGRGGPVGVDELRKSRPGEPGVAALPLSVRQAELVGQDAVARRRPGRRRRGHPPLRRGPPPKTRPAAPPRMGGCIPPREKQKSRHSPPTPPIGSPPP